MSGGGVGLAGRLRRANSHPVSHHSAPLRVSTPTASAYHSRSARISLRNAQYHVAEGNISLQRSALPGWGSRDGSASKSRRGVYEIRNLLRYGITATPCMESSRRDVFPLLLSRIFSVIIAIHYRLEGTNLPIFGMTAVAVDHLPARHLVRERELRTFTDRPLHTSRIPQIGTHSGKSHIYSFLRAPRDFTFTFTFTFTFFFSRSFHGSDCQIIAHLFYF